MMAVEQQSVVFRLGDYEVSERDMRLSISPSGYRCLP
jgi:hypothetical protein